MSRVSERQDQQRMEAERLQKRADKETRTQQDGQKSQQFGKMLQEKGARLAHGEAHAQKSAKEGAEQATPQGATKGDSARMRQLARGGADHSSRLMDQVKSFESTLARAGKETTEGNETLTHAKEESAFVGRTASEDRAVDVDQKAESQQERLKEDARAESADKAKANAAIDGRAGGGAGQGQQQSRDGNKDSSHVLAKPQAVDVAKANQAKTADAPKIPDALLEKLVSEVWHGVTAKGDHEFHIELKEGILAGAKMTVSSKDGKISLGFSGLDQNSERLIGASEGDLIRRFAAKGLTLDALTFTAKSA